MIIKICDDFKKTTRNIFQLLEQNSYKIHPLVKLRYLDPVLSCLLTSKNLRFYNININYNIIENLNIVYYYLSSEYILDAIELMDFKQYLDELEQISMIEINNQATLNFVKRINNKVFTSSPLTN